MIVWQSALVYGRVVYSHFAVGICVVGVDVVERQEFVYASCFGVWKSAAEVPTCAKLPFSRVAGGIRKHGVYVVSSVVVWVVGPFGFVGTFYIAKRVGYPQVYLIVRVFGAKVDTVGLAFFYYKVGA